MKLSVIICTYNPATPVIQRCLDHVRKAMEQGGGVEEVIVVDNNSSPALSERPELNAYMQPPFRFVVEKEQGLTPARLRGIREAKSELLVFVDDDNFVAEDFFEKGSAIAQQNPHIGAYSGQVKLEFESPAPAWTRPYWGMLVFREFEQDLWSNLPHLSATMPCGAGLFVRKQVADYYWNLHHEGKRTVQLDRKGKSLFSGGDNDLAACACDLGLGVGLFHELELDHYIPASRLTREYLLALTKGIATSAVVFKSFRNEMPQEPSLKTRIANMVRLATMDATARAFYKAGLEGEAEGRAMLTRMKPAAT